MAEDFRRVAKSLAVHLAHLREYRGIRFASAEPWPRDRAGSEQVVADQNVDADQGVAGPASERLEDPQVGSRATAQDAASDDTTVLPRELTGSRSSPSPSSPQRSPAPAPQDRRSPSPLSPEIAAGQQAGSSSPAEVGRGGQRGGTGTRERGPSSAQLPQIPGPRDIIVLPEDEERAATRPTGITRPGSSHPSPPAASSAASGAREVDPRATRGAPQPPRSPGEGGTRDVTSLRAKASEWSAAQKLDYLRDRSIGDCRRCALSQGRTNIVFGVGNPAAELMFVGEAPGFNEDRQGIPFVGRAGERLNIWLDMLGVPRDNAYIANVLKCRPPNNRDPHPVEVARCSPFLHAQIRAIQPKVLVALGRFAGNLLSGSEQLPLFKMRGRVLTYREAKHGTTAPVIVTYHPSYVLRQSGDAPPGKSKEDQLVLSDLRQAVEILRAPRP